MDRRNLLRGGLVLGAATAVPLLGAPAALAAVDQPDIANCAQWGARPPRSATTIVDSRPNKIVVHHTAMANSTDYSQAHAFANSRDIQNLHMDTRGWLDTGQHFTNSRGGWLTEGRHGSLYALLDFPGCAVVISHDRMFLDRVATHILAWEGDDTDPSKWFWYEGNFEAYEKNKIDRLGADAARPHRVTYRKLTRD